ncbi:MAG: hypothetical protein E7174_03085 [Firmicutes bacterium]|nr:hypothetical protein [Bacillota bacterium]
MESILEYIMLNYTWFLGGSIVIILAIIGSYADKTNFGQGNKKEELNTRENSNFNEQVTLKEYLESQKTVEQTPTNEIENMNPVETQKTETTNINGENQAKEMTGVNSVETQQPEVTNVNEENSNNQSQTIIAEENFEKFDKEFNELLPKKEIVDGDLLNEIENLSLDRTQKIKLTDIPDLDDVELPKIKSMPKEEDIWKF